MFDDFWAVWPHKKNRESARKAFAKLKSEDRQKATERAAEWCAGWRKDNPQASHIHASTYLNQKRFLDMDEAAQDREKVAEGLLEMQAGWIREGKAFLCQSLTSQRVQEIIGAGLVDQDECRKAGVL